MKDLSFAVVVGAFILTAIPAYAAEGAPEENAGGATAGHLKEGPRNGHGTKKWPDGAEYTGN